LASLEIIAHRGSGRSWLEPGAPPENTLPAFAYAWSPEVDADAAELDTRLTSDGELVVIHDATVDRTTNGHGAVSRLTFAEIRDLDAGIWKGPPHAGIRVPALEEVIAAVPAGKRLYIELKAGVKGIRRLAQAVQSGGASPVQLPVISFGLRTAAAVKQALPAHPCYLVTSMRGRIAFLDRLIRRVLEAGLDGIDAHYPASRALLRRIHETGLRSLVWTVNRAPGARRAAALGVSGITTDRPLRIRESLAGYRHLR
jgi:glycerophosphoryl diester phosphodiesterase